jgi:Mg-chelatase subunit ChlD
MRYYFSFISISILLSAHAQLIVPANVELGSIREAYEIKGSIIVGNNSGKTIYLMRADAGKGVKVFTSKKTLELSDTCLLIISFLPESKGNFEKKINLIASDRAEPYLITVTGRLENLGFDKRTACYDFGSRKDARLPVKDIPAAIPEPDEKRDASNRIPDPAQSETSHTITVPSSDKTKRSGPEEQKGSPSLLSSEEFLPNNITFLVDISGSMKDSLKLPLMKTALHHLIDQIRDVDRLSFVTYADTIKVIIEGADARKRQTLHELVDNLKAKGMTKGRKAIFFSQKLTQDYFIRNGNNQLIIATDGKFKFEKEDEKNWEMLQGNKPVILSTVAFGNEKDALKNLKDLAKKGKGSFIHIKERAGCETLLLKEIQDRSRKR